MEVEVKSMRAYLNWENPGHNSLRFDLHCFPDWQVPGLALSTRSIFGNIAIPHVRLNLVFVGAGFFDEANAQKAVMMVHEARRVLTVVNFAVGIGRLNWLVWDVSDSLLFEFSGCQVVGINGEPSCCRDQAGNEPSLMFFGEIGYSTHDAITVYSPAQHH